MSVYVGKNVGIVIQTPLEEDVSLKLIEKYTYWGIVQSETGSHEAHHHAASSEPSPPFGSELSDGEYDQIEKSDDTRFSKSTVVNNEYAMILFRFKCGFAEADVKKIVAKFEGYGTAPGGNGVTMKTWDHVSEAWSNMQIGTGSGDEEITITLTSNIGNYIDANGYIWVLVRTTNPSDGSTAAVLYCDYAHCIVTKAKFTTAHKPISDKDMDGVADEPAHVNVTKNDLEVTVSAVDDSEGLVTLASGDFTEDDVIVCKYRYDAEPYVAQEIMIEPKQTIEGIDGLGSDTVQLWAALLKGFEGRIKELYRNDEQLKRIPAMAYQEITRGFSSDAEEAEWEAKKQTFDISGGQFNQNDGAKGISLFKLWRGKDFVARVKVYPTYTVYMTFVLRYKDNSNYFYAGVTGTEADGLQIKKIINDEVSFEDDVYCDIQQGNNYLMTVKVYGNAILLEIIDHQGKTRRAFTESSTLKDYNGSLGFFAYAGTAVFDDLNIKNAIPFDDYGLIVTFDDGSGNIVRVGFDKVTFPESSIPSPKNNPVFIVTPFKAMTAKLIA